jgi:hypothetical protein
MMDLSREKWRRASGLSHRSGETFRPVPISARSKIDAAAPVNNLKNDGGGSIFSQQIIHPFYQKLPWMSTLSSSLKSWGYQCMGWFSPMKISIMVVASSAKCIWDVFTKVQAKPGKMCLGLTKRPSL